MLKDGYGEDPRTGQLKRIADLTEKEILDQCAPLEMRLTIRRIPHRLDPDCDARDKNNGKNFEPTTFEKYVSCCLVIELAKYDYFRG